VISRRRFLLASLLAPAMARAAGSVRFASHPFTLGIASGYPAADGVALWTRLAPSPLDGGGMAPDPVRVAWEVAEDEGFRRIARKGTAMAVAENAHAVHAEVDGLLPAREYFYRFTAGNEVSAVGRTRTAPAPGQGERLRMALATCQQYEQGYFVAHRHLAADDPDLVVFLGDYIYESSWGRDHVRRHHQPEPKSLAQYRDRYALYKTDADLQKSHAAAPWIVTWDDHEVDNDYANDRAEDLDPGFLDRRAAAYKAFYEHMPLRRSVLLAGGGMRIYGALDWGGLARFHVLDDRQYRSHQVCPRAGRGGSAFVGGACTDRTDPKLTLLGSAQEQWLDESLAESRAAWNVIAQQTLFVPAARRSGKDVVTHWTDGWDGYPAARERLLRSLVQRRPANPLIVGGDVHAAMTARVHAEPANPESPVVASEVVATSITSQGFASWINATRRENPHIEYAETEKRGYALIELQRSRAEARHRAVDSVKRADAGVSTAAAFTLESGRPGWIPK
jgi:alkaline phosphatase D